MNMLYTYETARPFGPANRKWQGIPRIERTV